MWSPGWFRRPLFQFWFRSYDGQNCPSEHFAHLDSKPDRGRSEDFLFALRVDAEFRTKFHLGQCWAWLRVFGWPEHRFFWGRHQSEECCQKKNSFDWFFNPLFKLMELCGGVWQQRPHSLYGEMRQQKFNFPISYIKTCPLVDAWSILIKNHVLV